MKMLFKYPLRFAPILALALAGCSGGLFKRADPNTLEPEGGYIEARIDSRTLVDSVTAITLSRTPGGLIVRATGLPPTQGYWDVGLARDRSDDVPNGTRRYRFVGRPPVDVSGNPIPATVGTATSRQVDAAVFIPDTELNELRQIIIVGAQGSRTARR
ncbi:hypothetical protein G5B39_11775 [Rhodobacteraceae bacterium SC52]|nr:hypothetical protein G5B39_11775 [Rhodobacteraceae bacterium SC52]